MLKSTRTNILFGSSVAAEVWRPTFSPPFGYRPRGFVLFLCGETQRLFPRRDHWDSSFLWDGYDMIYDIYVILFQVSIFLEDFGYSAVVKKSALTWYTGMRLVRGSTGACHPYFLHRRAQDSGVANGKLHTFIDVNWSISDSGKSYDSPVWHQDNPWQSCRLQLTPKLSRSWSLCNSSCSSWCRLWTFLLWSHSSVSWFNTDYVDVFPPPDLTCNFEIVLVVSYKLLIDTEGQPLEWCKTPISASLLHHLRQEAWEIGLTFSSCPWERRTFGP